MNWDLIAAAFSGAFVGLVLGVLSSAIIRDAVRRQSGSDKVQRLYAEAGDLLLLTTRLAQQDAEALQRRLQRDVPNVTWVVLADGTTYSVVRRSDARPRDVPPPPKDWGMSWWR